jgi:ribose/xylose/arabinose/galactoside ABC-type transport system permease subunit
VIGGIALTGGVGKMIHTFYGVLILGVIPNVINQIAALTQKAALTPLDNSLITGALLLAVVLLQSRIAGPPRSVGGMR